MVLSTAIKIDGSGQRGHGDDHFITVSGLTAEEAETLRASLLGGHCFVRRSAEGRLQKVPSYEPLPGPIEDTAMLPWWRMPTGDEPRQLELFDCDAGIEMPQHSDPAIYITGLCGYHYTPENYVREAAFLTDCGFMCMRSPRDQNSSKFAEAWYLPGVWAATGRLKDALFHSTAGTKIEKFKFTLEFLRRRASFGSLDISFQRMYMPIPD